MNEINTCTIDGLTSDASELFADVVEEYSELRPLLAELLDWHRRAPRMYRDAFVTEYLRELLAPLLRVALLGWHPFSAAASASASASSKASVRSVISTSGHVAGTASTQTAATSVPASIGSESSICNPLVYLQSRDSHVGDYSDTAIQISDSLPAQNGNEHLFSQHFTPLFANQQWFLELFNFCNQIIRKESTKENPSKGDQSIKTESSEQPPSDSKAVTEQPMEIDENNAPQQREEKIGDSAKLLPEEKLVSDIIERIVLNKLKCMLFT